VRDWVAQLTRKTEAMLRNPAPTGARYRGRCHSVGWIECGGAEGGKTARSVPDLGTPGRGLAMAWNGQIITLIPRLPVLVRRDRFATNGAVAPY
jgi:hypothetical protein